MKSKYMPVALLVLTVALAGCTQLPGNNQGNQDKRAFTFTQNDGLSISFSAANAEWFESDGNAVFTA
ncbi:MAG: hypothetical protein ABEI07_02610, partial [Candidatus Nanohaloarchaea archaeon]